MFTVSTSDIDAAAQEAPCVTSGTAGQDGRSQSASLQSPGNGGVDAPVFTAQAAFLAPLMVVSLRNMRPSAASTDAKRSF